VVKVGRPKEVLIMFDHPKSSKDIQRYDVFRDFRGIYGYLIFDIFVYG